MNLSLCMLVAGVLLIFAGCWCLIRTGHILKILVGIEVANKAVCLFLLLAGWLNGQMGLAQTFIVTVIVIEVVVAAVLAGIAVNLNRKFGSMDIRNLRNLKG